MHLEILTPEETLFKGDVESVKLPGAKGSFEVLNNHAPLVSKLDDGQINIKKEGGQMVLIEIPGGIVEVLKNNITVLV